MAIGSGHTVRSDVAARRLTRKEESLWLVQQTAGPNPVANETLCLRFAGTLDAVALDRAFVAVVDRHPALRTTFPDVDGVPMAVARPAGQHGACLVVERVNTEQEALANARRLADTPFDITGELPIRAVLHTGTGSDLLCLVFHHLCYDGASANVVVEGLVDGYEALRTGGDLPDDPGTPAPAPASRRPAAADLAYWRDHLVGVEPARQRLAVGGPDPARPTFAGAAVTRPMSAAARDALARVRRDLRAPDSVVLMAAWFAVLGLHGAGPDVVVGCRMHAREPHEVTTVGFLSDTQALRARADPRTTFRALSTGLRAAFVNGLNHRGVSHEEVLALLPPDAGAPWRARLFRHVFNYWPGGFDASARDRDRGPLTALGRPVHVWEAEPQRSRYDLELVVNPEPAPGTIELIFSTEIHDRGTATALLDRYDRLLSALPGHLDHELADVPWWSADDERIEAAEQVSVVFVAGSAAAPVPALPGLPALTPVPESAGRYTCAVPPGARLLVADGHGMRLPPGVPGELHVAGGPEPEPAAQHTHRDLPGRCVATGIRARRMPDGAFETIGDPPAGPVPEPAAASDRCGAGVPVTVELLTGLWREALGDPGLGPDDHFFLNGGNSMLAMRMLVKLRRLTGTEESLRDLLAAPTPAQFARGRIDRAAS